MSFGYGVGDAIAVCQLATKLRKDFVSAPGQLKSIHTELKGLSHVLQDVEDLLSEEDLSPYRDKHLRDILTGCHTLLNDVSIMVNKNSVVDSEQSQFSGKARRVWKRLNWDPSDVNELRARMATQVALLNAFMSSLTTDSVFAIRDSVHNLRTRQEEQEREKIINWVSDADYSLQQADFLSRREEGTGEWLIESGDFHRWMSIKKLTMFCPGVPGCGKTILTSIVIDNLQSRFAENPKVGVAFVYCNFRRKSEQSAWDLLGSILRQLLFQLPTLPPAFIVLDALDELPVSRDGRDKLLAELFKLQDSTGVNLFATSRFIPDIERIFGGALVNEIRGHPDDIRRYLMSSFSGFRSFVTRNVELQNEIVDKILKSVDGIFLLAQLSVQALQEKTTAKAMRLALRKLPKLLPSTISVYRTDTPQAKEAYDLAYEEAMERISTQHPDSRDLAMKVLSWISQAKRPLTTVELQHALAVEEDEEDLDLDNAPAIEDMISVCAGLVIVDEQSRIIRLLHYTAQEYFERTLHLWFPGASEYVARTCVQYLQFYSMDWDFSRYSLSVQRYGKGVAEFKAAHPFYGYAVEHWGRHCRGSPMDGSLFLSQFLKRERNFIEGTVEANICSSYYYPITPVRVCAYFGLYRTLKILATEGVRVNPEDPQTIGPLHLAAHEGHVDVVEFLLKHGAVVDQPYQGKTSFYIAARQGHLDVLSSLMEAGANPNRKADGRTPLLCATCDNNVRTAQFLLQREEVDLHAEGYDTNGYGMTTALMEAISRCHDELAILLSNTGRVNVAMADRKGKQPTSCADSGGEEFSSLHLRGGDITRQIYKWGEYVTNDMQRSKSFSLSRPEPENETLDINSIKVPGGFRRNFLQRAARGASANTNQWEWDGARISQGRNVFTSSFLEYLSIQSSTRLPVIPTYKQKK
ncbi:hypothetical protein FNYG_15490 [Fusarium nygamai]|uniref:Uncharacterized protein n=1 Tax=Gibberella nygamai TaxID=42673 RepID=A0A2K0UCP6_GIBNY|nr:hypothetical protein FNYG_15490 [Fusarium nygamai]